jgi:hypothetical protein
MFGTTPDLAGGWLNGMRNTLNAQVYAFKEPNFLCVSGTYGPAHLALYDQTTWDKYQLAQIAGSNISSNTFIVVPAAASHDPDNDLLDGANHRSRRTGQLSKDDSSSVRHPAPSAGTAWRRMRSAHSLAAPRVPSRQYWH